MHLESLSVLVTIISDNNHHITFVAHRSAPDEKEKKGAPVALSLSMNRRRSTWPQVSIKFNPANRYRISNLKGSILVAGRSSLISQKAQSSRIVNTGICSHDLRRKVWLGRN